MDKQYQNIYFHNGLMGIYKYVLIGLFFSQEVVIGNKNIRLNIRAWNIIIVIHLAEY